MESSLDVEHFEFLTLIIKSGSTRSRLIVARGERFIWAIPSKIYGNFIPRYFAVTFLFNKIRYRLQFTLTVTGGRDSWIMVILMSLHSYYFFSEQIKKRTFNQLWSKTKKKSKSFLTPFNPSNSLELWTWSIWQWQRLNITKKSIKF